MKFHKNALALAVMLATSTLTACGSSSSDDPAPTPVPTPEPVNSAPTDITLSDNGLYENKVDENVTGEEIGTLLAADPDPDDTFTYTVDNEAFSIDGDKLSVVKGLDFEAAESVMINVTATDSAGATYTQEIEITVNDLPDYDFKSKLVDDAKSVSYSGQIARHALISELTHFIGNQLTDRLNPQDENHLQDKAAVLAELDKYFRTTEEQWDNFPITFIEDSKQKSFADISSPKNLVGKIAGNDSGGQDIDFLTEFSGWAPKGDITPEALIDTFFDQLADNAAAVVSGVDRKDPITNESIPVYVNEDGTDLKQLIQKFLLVAITFSQSSGDYLGADTEGKGLTTDNTAEDKNGYTKLEHQYDEGFGYFGATVDYLAYNDKEIAAKVKTEEDGREAYNGKHDFNGDGEYDLLSEVIFGAAANAAKRDLGTVGNTNPTDLTKETMEAFIAGRKIINDNVLSALTDEQLDALYAQRDIAIGGWEKALAATAIHYINDLRADLEPISTGEGEFDFTTAAKHFSELKGFAIGLQFSPFSLLESADFEQVHQLIGNQPVLSDATAVETYRQALEDARDILEAAYNFDADNVAGW
jgi:hypothetical protein